VLVLREGRLVEHLQTGRLDSARHPYTRALLDAAAF
jgi:ABC-type dipeptide/oligopeptide/nickel transport system ATPase component